MALEIKDLAGISQPMTKLVEVVSSAIGTLYRPRGIRSEADAKAYEIKAIEKAKTEAQIQSKDAYIQSTQNHISIITKEYPELAERARLRLLSREIEGQINIEQIVEHAALALPSVASHEPISTDWRRKFFQEAENVCEGDLQLLWGKVLAGEIANPGSFSLRTLETMKQLSRNEAELFSALCDLAMDDGSVAIPGTDLNTTLKPFGFGYDKILKLRDAGLLLHGDSISRQFPSLPDGLQPEMHKIILRNNGIFIQVSGSSLSNFQLLSLVFTQSGREIQKLIVSKPNEAYLAALGNSMRQRGLVVKRGIFTQQNESTSLILFEKDL